MIEQCVNAEQAAQRATELAEQALAFGTFGVGALLIDKGGRVLREERNRVIENTGVRLRAPCVLESGDLAGACGRERVVSI